MADFKLSESDEFPHAPTEDSNFNESVYVNGFDAEARLGGWMRLGNRVHERHAELQVCMYLPDGRIACQFARPALESNERFSVAGMDYRVDRPLESVSMDFEGELMVLEDPNLLRDPRRLFEKAPRLPGRISYRLEGVSPVHGGEPTRDDQQTMYGRDFSYGHFNQHTRTVGSIEVGTESWSFDAFGWRDHSWGPRYWTNIYFYRLLIANFGRDRGMMLLKITGRDGITRREGVLLVDGRYEEITDLDLFTEWTPEMDPAAIRLGVRTRERAVRMEGRVLRLAPLRNRRRVDGRVLQSRIAEGFTEWTWDDRRGIGVSEYIELLEDGVPVGYPL